MERPGIRSGSGYRNSGRARPAGRLYIMSGFLERSHGNDYCYKVLLHERLGRQASRQERQAGEAGGQAGEAGGQVGEAGGQAGEAGGQAGEAGKVLHSSTTLHNSMTYGGSKRRPWLTWHRRPRNKLANGWWEGSRLDEVRTTTCGVSDPEEGHRRQRSQVLMPRFSAKQPCMSYLSINWFPPRHWITG